MAVDKKGDHYTSAKVYRDLDGNHKQFTFIDHDKKPTISTSVLSDSERDDLKMQVNKDIEEAIEEILALPAVSLLASGNSFAEDYILRDVENNKIVWREAMVRDALRINDNLRHTFKRQVWANTVREQFWFEDMSHEDILAGKWKEWM